MKRLIVLFFVMNCLLEFSFSQIETVNGASKFTLGVFGGLNIPNLSGGGSNPLSDGYTSILGGSYGLTSSYSLGSHFDIVLNALYSGEGGQKNGTQAIEASSVNPQAPGGTYMYATYNNESMLNYLEIPLMLKYSIPVGQSPGFYVDLGPYIGFLLNAKQKSSGSSYIYANQGETQPMTPMEVSFNSTTDVTSSVNPLTFGITGGVGFGQKAGPGSIFLDLRGAYGLTQVQQNSQDGSSHSGYLAITLGYAIPL